MISKKYIPIGIDFFFCIVLIPALMMILPVEKWLVSNSIFVLLLIAWLYAVYFCVKEACLPMLFKGKKRMLLAVGILLATVLGTWLITQYQMDYPFRGNHPRTGKIRQSPLVIKVRLHQQATWFMYVITLCFSVAVGLLNELYRQIMVRQTVEYEKKKAELALYKAQINPHFLFNTLNTLYGMIIAKSEKAEAAFMQFIELMRYMYANGTKDTVSVAEEAEYIGQYIELQKNRMDETRTHVQFSYVADEGAGRARIAPMILMTFVENALKYGVSSFMKSDVTIRLVVHDGMLSLFTENPVVNPRPEKKEPGIGISNCRKRLDLIYPDRYSLEITNTGNVFTVNLNLKLK